MLETIITSSLLIVIIIALRFLLRGKLSPVVIYALWATVALRLLVPVSLFDSRMSVMNLFEVQPASTFAADISNTSVPTVQHNESLPIPNDHSNTTGTTAPSSSEHHSHAPGAPNGLSAWSEALVILWIAGALCVLAVTVVRNARFCAKLKAVRKPLDNIAPIPVFVASGIASPCLVGILRPCVYVNRFAAENEQRMRYVLAHELAHYRHLDHIWAAVRMLCVTLHWFNPLVWFAAHLSRQDSELACDSAVISELGEQYRFEYGRTLIDMVPVHFTPIDILAASTSMSSGSKGISDRVRMIKARPKTLVSAAVTAALIIVFASLVTFTGTAENATKPETDGAHPGTTATENCPDIIAEYSLPYASADSGRSRNIELAAQLIDGRLLQPGETFSFNEAIGDLTPERGFVEAEVFSYEAFVGEYGGGITSVADALYNTAFLSGMDIADHSPAIHVSPWYMNSGEKTYGSAACSWGKDDLCFINSHEFPVMIAAGCADGVLTVRIYGTGDGTQFRMERVERDTHAHTVIYYPSDTLSEDQEGVPERTVDVYRDTYENGVFVGSEPLYTAVYKAVPTIMYTDRLPAGYEYGVEYISSEVTSVTGSEHYYPEGTSAEKIWSDPDMAYLLENVPVFDMGYLTYSCYLLEGIACPESNAMTHEGNIPLTDMLMLVFEDVTQEKVLAYISRLAATGFIYGTDEFQGVGVYYNARQLGIGVQIEESGLNAYKINVFPQGDGTDDFGHAVSVG